MLEVAEHLRLGPVAVEDRVRQDRPALAGSVDDGEIVEVADGLAAEDVAQERREVVARHRLAEGHADLRRAEHAQIEARGLGLFGDARGVDAGDDDGVEGRVAGVDAVGVERLRRGLRQTLAAPRDGLEALGAVVDGVGRGHVRQERLGRADVRRGLVAADVLLARLHGHPQRAALALVRLDGLADDAAGHAARVLLGRGHVGRVGAAEAHGHAVALHGAHGDVDAEGRRRRQQREREGVRGADGERSRVLGLLRDGRAVGDDVAARVRVLPEHADAALGQRVARRVADDDGDVQRLAARADDGDGLRVALGVAEEGEGRVLLLAVFGKRDAHGHGLGRGRRLVQKRRVGHLHARELRHEGLVVQEHLEAALGDLGLVGRVRRVPARVLEHVAQDDERRVRLVVAQAHHGLEHLVLLRHGLEERQRLRLGHGLGLVAPELERLRQADVRRHRRRHELVEGREAERREHLGLVRLGRAHVALLEGVEGVQRLDLVRAQRHDRRHGAVAARRRRAERGALAVQHAPQEPEAPGAGERHGLDEQVCGEEHATIASAIPESTIAADDATLWHPRVSSPRLMFARK
mmetsp:Transcript_8984/g.30826  ORF Transcript_8984/g.30826 Transcript_8984/m.30826 type:complete len:581 (-) Transcript_8984:38-1780(-)